MALTIGYPVALKAVGPEIVHKNADRILPRPDPAKQDRVAVDEMHVVAVPTEGTTRIGEPRRRYDFTLLPNLPAEYRITGMKALQAVFDAVNESGVGTRRDAAFATIPDDALVYERLGPSLPAMLSPEGSRHSAVVNATEIINLGNGHVTVHAAFGEIGQIYFMEKAEFEKYDHGTDLTSSQVARSRRHTIGVDGYGMAPVAAPPAVPFLQWVGGRLTLAYERGYLTSADQTAWIEHRAWLRQDSAVFFIYATLQLTAVVSSASARTTPVPTVGLVELVTNRDGALELGIPIDVLRSVVPPGKWSKVFSDDPTPPPAPPEPEDLVLSDAQQALPGLYFAVGALSIGNATQLLWLRHRARPLLRALAARTPDTGRPLAEHAPLGVAGPQAERAPEG